MNMRFCITCAHGYTYYNTSRTAISDIFIDKDAGLPCTTCRRELTEDTYDFPGSLLNYVENEYWAVRRELKEALHPADEVATGARELFSFLRPTKLDDYIRPIS